MPRRRQQPASSQPSHAPTPQRKPTIRRATGLEPSLPLGDEFLARYRTIADLLGAFGFPLTPMDVADFPGLKAVSQFMRGGVPDVVLRSRYTQKFLDRAKSMFPEYLHAALEQLAARFPRIAAHTELRDLPYRGGDVAGATHWSRPTLIEELIEGGRVGGVRTPVDLYEGPPDLLGNPGPRSLDVLYHELAHVAQGLGNRDAPDLYHYAYQALGGKPGPLGGLPYINNPFERSARNISLRKARDMASQLAPLHVTKLLNNMLDAGIGIPEQRTPEIKNALDQIDAILRRRGVRTKP